MLGYLNVELVAVLVKSLWLHLGQVNVVSEKVDMVKTWHLYVQSAFYLSRLWLSFVSFLRLVALSWVWG